MINKIKKIKLRDVFGILKFLIMLLPALIYRFYLKIRKKQLWLICETERTARDNGIVFYKYMIKEHKEIKCYYAIDKKSNDYNSIREIENIIQWSSLKHYFYYMAATKNVSSHKEGNPNHMLFTILHLYLKLFNNRVFLQHGVLYQNFDMFHKKNTYFKIFICGAKPEYEFVKEKYGYEDEVKYTGLARFDNLHNTKPDSNVILYMPTWRRWLDTKEKLIGSEYYKKIMSFINSKELENLLNEKDKYLYFCPHGGLRDFKEVFYTNNSRVKIIDISKVDIQKTLIEGSLLITDFSSLHTDFAYMKKPIIYYQYDEKDFKEKHYGKNKYNTYYDFRKDGFGEVVNDEKNLLIEIDNNIESNFKEDEKYVERIRKFFELYDNKNCERIYEVIRDE